MRPDHAMIDATFQRGVRGRRRPGTGGRIGDALSLAGMAVVAVALLAGAACASAQTRKEQADRVVKQYDAPSAAACALLSGAQAAKITGRPAYDEPQGTQLTNGGSTCNFDDVSVTLFSGPRSAEHYEALLKNFKQDKAPRTPVSGVGDSAYLMVVTSGPRSAPDQHAVLVVRHGQHTVAISLEALETETPQSLQPKLASMARAALANLR